MVENRLASHLHGRLVSAIPEASALPPQEVLSLLSLGAARRRLLSALDEATDELVRKASSLHLTRPSAASRAVERHAGRYAEVGRIEEQIANRVAALVDSPKAQGQIVHWATSEHALPLHLATAHLSEHLLSPVTVNISRLEYQPEFDPLYSVRIRAEVFSDVESVDDQMDGFDLIDEAFDQSLESGATAVHFSLTEGNAQAWRQVSRIPMGEALDLLRDAARYDLWQPTLDGVTQNLVIRIDEGGYPGRLLNRHPELLGLELA